MTIPNENHPGWLKAISGEGDFKFEFLATKMVMGRLNSNYKKDSSPAATKQLIADLRDFFQQNSKLPKAQADLKKIVEGR
ncbi:hypothetical protein Dvar_66380 [Desulfosarcina variabilis str. Montpellier]|uniref:hypothetical protein n=1 Tax=Desulfosarcina variabilis TaxID=2300 RepID=UPI003AFB762F